MAEKEKGKQLNTKELFFNYTTEMACIAGFDGYFKELNPAWSRVLGWSTEELLARPWNDIVHPDDIESTNSATATIVDGEEVYTFENRYLCKDGNYKWLSWSSRSYPEEKIIFGVARDVTIQKEQALELEKQHEKLVKLTNRMPGVVYEFQLFPDGKMQFPFASPGMDHIFGHAPEEVRLKGQLAFEKVHPDDIERVYKETFHSAENLTHFYCEFRIVRPDGSIEWRLCDAVPERLEDGSTLWYGMIIDISSQKKTEEALRQSEESYRLLFENNPHPMWLYDVETLKFIEVNKAVIQKYGYTREEFLSMSILDIRPSKDVDRLLDHIRKDTDELSYSGEWQHLQKNGELIWVEVISHKLNYKNHNAKLVLLNDITERRKAINELKESQFLLNEAQKITKLGSWNFDFRNDVLTWSDGLYDVFDVDRDTFKETHGSFLSLIDEDDRERAQQVSRHTQKTGEPFHVIYGITTPKGERRQIEEYGLAEKDESGNIVRLYGTAQNVTEKLKIQEQMLNSDRIFRYASDMLCIVGFDGFFKVVNPAWTNILGWSEEELLSKPYREFVHPDDRELTDQENEKVIVGEGSLDFENRYLCKDGSYRWFSWKSYPFTDEQKVYAVVRDITRQKEIEQGLVRLSVAVKQNPAGIVITDLDGRIEYVNPAFTNLTGYTTEEARGENPNILKSGRQSSEFYENLWSTISSGNVWKGELHNRKKNGELYWERATIAPVKNSEGDIINYLAIKEDITEWKNTEDKLIESERRFREIFETLPVISVQGYDRNRNLIYWNKASEDLYGYKKEEAIGRKIEDLIIPDEMWDNVIANIQNWVDNDISIPSSELILQKKDGSKVHVYSNHVLLRNIHGEPEMFCIDIDLTDLKQKELKLKESEERYRSIIAVSNTGAYEYNFKTDELWVSSEYLKMIGYNGGEISDPLIVDKNFWLELLHPDDRERAVDTLQEYLAGDMLGDYENYFRLKHKDGSDVWVWSRAVNLKNSDGSPKDILLGTHIDITELQQKTEKIEESELYHRSLIQTIPDMVIVFDKDGKFLDIKYSDKNNLIMEPSKFLGKNVEDIMPDEVSEKQMQATKQCIAEQKVVSFDYSLQLNGENRYFNSRNVAFGEDKVIATIRDITDYQENLDRIKQLLSIQEKQNEKLLNFTHIVSHNLRSHTANMQGILSLMHMDEPEIFSNPYVDLIKTSAENLNETIANLNEVLDMSFGDLDEKTSVNLHETVDKAIKSVSTLA